MLYIVILRTNLIANSCFMVKEFIVRIVKHFPGLIVRDVYEFSLHPTLAVVKDRIMNQQMKILI